VKPFSVILLSALPIINYLQVNKISTSTMDAKLEYTYLALGDSYTIGESLLQADNFPNQLVKVLDGHGLHFLPPGIVAKTGWTTDELKDGILLAEKNELLLPTYELVTLLIGVNNQYRGRSIEEYAAEFEDLLKLAISRAGGHTERVIVLSIPDWGVTPFANGRERKMIALEIDAFNTVNKRIALAYGTGYLNITPWTREAADDLTLVASDGLHPSAREYKRWAEKLADRVACVLK
jgi:lysophospholipase L1-like esterase